MLTSTSSKPYYILGISCFYHEAAAALLRNGQLVAAAREESFSRNKHDASFPVQAITYCLAEAKIASGDIGAVVFYEKPLLKFERILTSFIKSWPFEYRSFLKGMDAWLRDKLWIKPLIRQKLDYRGPIYFSEHHLSHAASAFFVSPFKQAAILTVDGVGEWTTAAWGRGNETEIELLEEIRYPSSLGLLYSAITYFLGFQPASDEYKVMGLAPYGRPVYREQLNRLLAVFPDGSFALRPGAFGGNYATSRVTTELEELLGFPRRAAGVPLSEQHKNLAASIQELTNETMVRLARYVRKVTGENNLCLAGGVALNAVANTQVFRRAGFKHIFIQPAAGDAGGALGAAYFVWHHIQRRPRSFTLKHAFWGPGFTNEAVQKILDDARVPYRFLPRAELVRVVAQLLQGQKVVGWFQGRLEWGPRALGNRSLLADARNADNWQRVNQKIKFRESFRPFAPVVLREYADQYFEWTEDSPYMLFTAPVKRQDIPAVTHVDGSARLQTVDKETNALFHQLLTSFHKLTGCPVLLNTSFNDSQEPIVCTPADALRTFQETDMDFLVLGNYLLDKQETGP
jgi:carbamoyltransferase